MTESASELRLMLGDCLERLRELPDCSVDSVVTDPPYGLSFMGKRWDYDVPSVEVWAECLRVLKPGGYLLAFAGTRTQHRMAVRIEDAGFEIRDMIAWVYGSGFPKSLDVSKAIDKAAGAERGEEQPHPTNQCKGGQWCKCQTLDATGRYSPTKHPAVTAPATDAAKQWQGFGTALKPSLEPITVARKPLGEKTVAANVLAHGTGGINVDGCRVGTEPPAPRNAPKKIIRGGNFHSSADAEKEMSHYNPTQGRWPANLIHDGSDEVLAGFPDRKTTWVSPKHANNRKGDFLGELQHPGQQGFNDSGSAARFFYQAKCSKKDRNEGLPEGTTSTHPTVKPTALMRYLCRLVTPPEGIVLDPFMGSGSTGKAALLEGFQFVGIERDPEYFKIATSRIAVASPLPPQNG